MNIKLSATRILGKKMVQAKKNSPHIFFAAGVVGVGVSTVMACKATLKLESTLDHIHEEVNKVKTTNIELTEKERNRLLSLKYARGGVELGKLYGPTIIVATASIGLLAGSHIQLTRRNSALSATLALVSQSFDAYRARVRAEIGENKENELYRGIETREVEGEDGKKHRVKELVEGGPSPYARKFSSQTTNEWHPNHELNRNFIECSQRYANHKLNADGFVMLNDVYDALGLERSTAGAVVGWVLNGDGDGFIDFGMYMNKDNAQFMIGDEYDVWLDFNVDGEVFRLIDKAVGKGK